jgi:hypothetical protein
VQDKAHENKTFVQNSNSQYFPITFPFGTAPAIETDADSTPGGIAPGCLDQSTVLGKSDE